jgi:hypothetical protein
MQTDEEAIFDCRATAAFLCSGTVLATAAHIAAIMTILVKRDAWAIAIWSVALYFSVRVRIDAEFFDILAAYPPQRLDNWLAATGLRKGASLRTVPDRRRGALRFWWGLLGAVVLQIALLVFRLVA